MGREVIVGTPSVDGTFHARYVEALIGTQAAMLGEGMLLTLRMVLQSSLIMEARNAVLADFIRSDATDLVFVDADIGWRPADFLRLLAHDVPLVAGVYRKKIDETVFTIGFVDAGNVRRDRSTGLIEAAHVGAGFLRIRRDCAARMAAAYPSLRYRERSSAGEAGEAHALFDTSIVDGTLRGEDYTFCDRWRAIGGAVWVDPEIGLAHVGTREYGGSLMASLTRNGG